MTKLYLQQGLIDRILLKKQKKLMNDLLIQSLYKDAISTEQASSMISCVEKIETLKELHALHKEVMDKLERGFNYRD